MKTVIATTVLVVVMGATYGFSAPGRHGSALRAAREAKEQPLARIKRDDNSYGHEEEHHGHGHKGTHIHDATEDHGSHEHHHGHSTVPIAIDPRLFWRQ
nr:protein catecholamines up-like [Penaeus vannamei]